MAAGGEINTGFGTMSQIQVLLNQNSVDMPEFGISDGGTAVIAGLRILPEAFSDDFGIALALKAISLVV